MGLAVLLAVLALLVWMGLALHEWWSVRRARPKVPPVSHLEDRVEPVLAPRAPSDGDQNSSPSQEPLEAPLETPRVPVRRAPRLDALIDVIVPLFLDEPVSGEMALAHLPHTRRAGSKPMMIEGLNAQTREWEHPVAGQVYQEFQAGVQLANRGGALNEIEYSEFVHKTQGFAEGLGSTGDFPDMLEVVARARELDEFASPLDAQITMTLRAQSTAWSVAYLQQCAASLGFVPGALPGRLVLPATEEGDPPSSSSALILRQHSPTKDWLLPCAKWCSASMWHKPLRGWSPLGPGINLEPNWPSCLTPAHWMIWATLSPSMPTMPSRANWPPCTERLNPET